MNYGRYDVSPESARDRRICPGGRRRPGTALVEFAIVGPIMLIMTLAVFEFGRTFMMVELLTEGARIGCRQGIIQGTSSQQIRDAVTDYLSGVGIHGETAGVIINQAPLDSVEAAHQQANTEITVQVTVPVKTISWVPNPLYTNGTLAGQFTMRRE
jgi:Flp pilus assembly protein TadG